MRILLATEGGEKGAKDIRFLSSVLRGGDHDVDMVYVKEVEEDMPEKHYEIAKETQEKKKVAPPGEGRKDVLEEMGDIADETGIQVEQIGLKGDPAEQILKKARIGSYDLISIGSGGRGIFTKEILGLVANRIVKESPISVMVAKGEKKSCQNVLICTKGEEESLGVFEFAGELFEGSDVEFTTLHVVESFSRLGGYMENVEEELQQVAQDFEPPGEDVHERGIEILEEHGLDSERKLREGGFAEQVLEESREGGHDLVVLGSHVLSDWFEKYWKGGDAVPIIRDLEQSFLLVRE